MPKRLTVIALAVLLAACGSSYAGDGTVTAKHYDDPDEWWTSTVICSKTCSVIPNHNYDPAHWTLDVRGDDGKKHTVEVSELEFAACLIESHWNGANRSCS